ncbi:MAG: response regulator [Chloroflexi bacterium]|nr:response regulator [Chloroflexota bacterium]
MMTTVLVVDDERGPRESLRMILKDGYDIATASSAEEAVRAVQTLRPAAVLLDIRLGSVDGIETLRLIRSIDRNAQVAMITAYASVETARLAMQLGAADYLTKPFDMGSVRDVVRGLVARHEALEFDSDFVRSLQEANISLAQTVGQYQEQVRINYAGTMEALITAIDAKDRFTRDHSVRVNLFARALSEELGLPREEIEIIGTAGMIHDIGKIGISEGVLGKNGKLTPEEWLEMKKHPTIGAEIISRVPSLEKVLPGVLEHHERPDGKGYPRGLEGDAISPIASILAVADSIDAMSSHRVYRAALHHEQITEELLRGAGSQWVAEVVHAAVRIRLPRRREEFTAPPGRLTFDLQ